MIVAFEVRRTQSQEMVYTFAAAFLKAQPAIDFVARRNAECAGTPRSYAWCDETVAPPLKGA